MASPYIQFPKKLLQCSYLTAQAKILYCVLYDIQRAQKAGSEKPYTEVRQKTLAVKLGLSLSQTKRLIKELTEARLLTVERYGNEVSRYYVTEPDKIKTDIEYYLIRKLDEERAAKK